jgi:Na+-translocating ferredoxin:NAD+ oxidoreductase RNF subunit RnfB
MNTIIFTVVVLSSLGVLLAVILYFVAQKFKVFEDPRIDEIVEMLPGANCGGCGYAGCRAFAEALVKNDDISALQCPVGGSNVMNKAAAHLGKTAVAQDAMIAVVRCAGSCEVRQRTNLFEGAKSCLVMASTYSGDTGCGFGCLGQGDCVVSCGFDAIRINPETLLPEVDEEKCTSCGSCVKACPKFIIELRKKGPKNRRIYVSCVNKDKGGVAKKSCEAACTGCTKCLKVCTFDSITIINNLAYIDNTKCRLCRKCVPECATGAIRELNFPPRKQEVKSE